MWLRILLGALAVFVVGTTAVHFGRRARDTVTHTLESDTPLPIPLAGLVAFRVDSVELGALKRLEFLRSSPSEISGVRVVVDLKSDASEAARLEGCQIGLRSLDNLDEHTSFTCITSDSGLEQFGFVYLVQQDDSLPLFLPVDAVRELRAAHLDFGRKGIRVRRVGEVGPTEVDADSIRRAVARELERAAAELERASAEVERARQATPRPPESPAPAAKP